jgi:hypothetical protein
MIARSILLEHEGRRLGQDVVPQRQDRDRSAPCEEGLEVPADVKGVHFLLRNAVEFVA